MVDKRLEEDYASHGFSGVAGFGSSPVLLVVDFIKGYTTPGSPLFAAPGVPDAVRATGPLLARCREVGVPVLYTRVEYAADGSDGGLFVKKVPALLELTGDSPMKEIVDELAPLDEETVIVKKYASAFFGTDLASMLRSMGVDTVLLVGCSTSGCIRASAVDGMQHGFRVVVPRECVGDRAPEPHEANLFDINGKYGDVIGVREVMNYLDRWTKEKS